MRLSRQTIALAFALVAACGSAVAQEPPPPGASPELPQSAIPQAAAAPAKQDALQLFRQGRDLETAGKAAEAQAKYAQSVATCDKELASDPSRIEAYVVKGWSLFRMGKYAEVISAGQAGLKVSFDARIVEVMGEAYYYLGRMDDCLRSLQKYIEVVGEVGDRSSTAYFYMGEAYVRLKKYSHADMAYSMALKRDANMPRWWFRLGGACESLGEWKRASDAYEKAIALSPAYKDAIDALARVKPKLQ
jgi:tetratricopeptide (TPR) repeat protein